MDDETLDLAGLQREALRAVVRVLRAPDAKPETLLRAAETLLRAEPVVPSTSPDAVRGMTDQELLAAARGEGGTPRERGPMVPSAGAVPSDAHTERSAPLQDAPRGTSFAREQAGFPYDSPPPPGIVRPAKGTQRGPVSTSPPGGPTSISQIAKRGPKTDPPIATPTPGVAGQIKIDDTPMPWE